MAPWKAHRMLPIRQCSRFDIDACNVVDEAVVHSSIISDSVEISPVGKELPQNATLESPKQMDATFLVSIIVLLTLCVFISFVVWVRRAKITRDLRHLQLTLNNVLKEKDDAVLLKLWSKDVKQSIRTSDLDLYESVESRLSDLQLDFEKRVRSITIRADRVMQAVTVCLRPSDGSVAQATKTNLKDLLCDMEEYLADTLMLNRLSSTLKAGLQTAHETLLRHVDKHNHAQFAGTTTTAAEIVAYANKIEALGATTNTLHTYIDDLVNHVETEAEVALKLEAVTQSGTIASLSAVIQYAIKENCAHLPQLTDAQLMYDKLLLEERTESYTLMLKLVEEDGALCEEGTRFENTRCDTPPRIRMSDDLIDDAVYETPPPFQGFRRSTSVASTSSMRSLYDPADAVRFGVDMGLDEDKAKEITYAATLNHLSATSISKISRRELNENHRQEMRLRQQEIELSKLQDERRLKQKEKLVKMHISAMWDVLDEQIQLMRSNSAADREAADARLERKLAARASEARKLMAEQQRQRDWDWFITLNLISCVAFLLVILLSLWNSLGVYLQYFPDVSTLCPDVATGAGAGGGNDNNSQKSPPMIASGIGWVRRLDTLWRFVCSSMVEVYRYGIVSVGVLMYTLLRIATGSNKTSLVALFSSLLYALKGIFEKNNDQPYPDDLVGILPRLPWFSLCLFMNILAFTTIRLHPNPWKSLVLSWRTPKNHATSNNNNNNNNTVSIGGMTAGSSIESRDVFMHVIMPIVSASFAIILAYCISLKNTHV